MFHDCYSLISFDLSSFNTSKVTNLASMFMNCESLENINFNNGISLDSIEAINLLFSYDKKEIEDEYGVEVMYCVTDVTDYDNVAASVQAVVDKFGRIDILINNAGTGAVAPAEDITDEQLFNELEIDLGGTFKFARACAKKAMIPAKYGRIINIASMYGMVGNKVAPASPYHAAKGGVVNLTRALASEWGKYGITVNSICPGYFYTELTTETLNSDYFQAFANQSVPMKRYGNEGELNSVAIFLGAEESSYITGQAIAVDGGYTCV